MSKVVFVVLLAIAGLVDSHGWDQPFRPQFHFSPREHWTNDPNGLVYFEGEYHLFFQYNPFGDEWGHMSWGHAVSTDMLHWTELPVALKEEDGIMIFTGSAVVDTNNSSGFCSNGKACLVAVYTGYTPAKGSRPSLQTQNVAYSNDRGRTWTKYRGNPVLDLHMTDFRDPKVFWYEPSGHWIMAVSLPNDHKVRFYQSADLKKWSQLSDFGPAGATGGQWECPEIFELPVMDRKNETRWVLKVGLNPGGRLGGSGEQYFIGRFDGKQFTNDNPASLTLWTDYGKDCYCALTFNGLPRDREPVMLGWMDNWQYAAKLPTSPWRGQMTIPRRLWLQTTKSGIRLFQQPVTRLEDLRAQHIERKDVSIEDVNRALAEANIARQHTFELDAAIDTRSAQQTGWRILRAGGTETVIGYDRLKSSIFIDRRRSGTVGFSPEFPTRMEAALNVPDVVHMQIFVDRSSVELFADNGSIAITSLVFPPADADGIQAYAIGGAGKIVQISAWSLRSIH